MEWTAKSELQDDTQSMSKVLFKELEQLRSVSTAHAYKQHGAAGVCLKHNRQCVPHKVARGRLMRSDCDRGLWVASAPSSYHPTTAKGKELSRTWWKWEFPVVGD